MKLKNILCLGALCFLVACGDSDMVKFSKEDLADPRLQEGFNKIKAKNNNDNLEFYAIESIQKKYPKLYNTAKQQEIKKEDEYSVGVYVINKTKNNIELLYAVKCNTNFAGHYVSGCTIKDETKAIAYYK